MGMMTKRTPFGARLRYEFDKTMAAGTIALIGWLSLVSLVVIFIAGIIIAVTRVAPVGGEPVGLIEAMWAALMRSMDAGTMGGDTGWAYRLIALAVTLSGIFIFSTLIGILGAGVNSKLEQLRKGRSKVLESDHTIILNWSPSILDIISELVIANASRKRPRIVIMANKDKVEMEDEIAAKVADLRNTRIICRNGDPTDLYDLSIVNPQTSRSIIIVSPEGDDPDSQVIKSVLALVNDPNRRKEPYRIAAEIRDGKNADVARVVGGKETQLVLADDLIARVVVHSSRQAGLSAVYSELLDFDGCEIYTAEQPELVGRTFGDAVMAFDHSTLIGLCDRKGKVYLNPPMKLVIPKGVKAIIIAEDDAAIRIAGKPPRIDENAMAAPRRLKPKPETTLILGWNRRGPVIVREMARYVAPGSALLVAAWTPELEAEIEALRTPAGNMSIDYRAIDTSDRHALEALDIPSFDHVLVLGYSDHMAPQPADTRTLVTLLHLRRIAETSGRRVPVVSEMTDIRNRQLAEVTRADDFVVSNKLVSLMLAQASENEHLAAIFDDLLDEKGSEIYMRPAADYVRLDTPVNFHTVADAARLSGEVAIGYRRKSREDGARGMGGVVVNPQRTELVTYSADDKVIVLARD
jgi:voltage-gated potassium channel Kch